MNILGTYLWASCWSHSRRTPDNGEITKIKPQDQKQYANMVTLGQKEGKQLVFVFPFFFFFLPPQYIYLAHLGVMES